MRRTPAHEGGRKAVHAIGGILTPITFEIFGKQLLISGVLACLFLSALFEFLRLRRGKPVFYSGLLRSYEESRLAGHVFFLMGVLVCVALFEGDVAMAAVLMLAAGDGVSGVVKSRMRGLAPLSMFVTSAAVGCIYVPPPVSTLGALGATLADSLPLRSKYLDDNLTIPLFSATLMQLSLSQIGR
ncbi:MAG: diacylglycerol/polyprenol kinase family protein [Candidatus Alkanophagales archaeon]